MCIKQHIRPVLVCPRNDGASPSFTATQPLQATVPYTTPRVSSKMADHSTCKGARIMNVRQLSFVLVLGQVGRLPHPQRTKTKTAVNQSTTMEGNYIPKAVSLVRHPNNRSLSLQ